jgi:hypothetical protein
MFYSVCLALTKLEVRSLRVKNLPEDTQEPLLQQVFERLMLVKRMEPSLIQVKQ